ncbi:hypothetical protein PMAYCL1PPCAC_05229, partial [Pristionchus mayeri]
RSVVTSTNGSGASKTINKMLVQVMLICAPNMIASTLPHPFHPSCTLQRFHIIAPLACRFTQAKGVKKYWQ